jgi:hypothetical protein
MNGGFLSEIMGISHKWHQLHAVEVSYLFLKVFNISAFGLLIFPVYCEGRMITQ